MSRPIDPNAPFVRITFDLATADAVKLEQLWLASGKNKKQFFAGVFTDYIASNTAQKGKGKKK